MNENEYEMLCSAVQQQKKNQLSKLCVSSSLIKWCLLGLL